MTCPGWAAFGFLCGLWLRAPGQGVEVRLVTPALGLRGNWGQRLGVWFLSFLFKCSYQPVRQDHLGLPLEAGTVAILVPGWADTRTNYKASGNGERSSSKVVWFPASMAMAAPPAPQGLANKLLSFWDPRSQPVSPKGSQISISYLIDRDSFRVCSPRSCINL